MSDDSQVERHIDKVTLTNLFNSDMAAQRAAAEERGAIASRIRGLKESHGLNTSAYGIAKRIAKLPSGEAAQLKRAVDFYCDLLEVGAQGDLEDVIERNARAQGGRTETEATMDGQPGQGNIPSQADRADAGRVGSIVRPGTPAGDAALARFTEALEEVTDLPTANTALDRFTKDKPYLSEKAAEIAIRRITAIEQAQSDGEEDLRPDHLKTAGATAARQTAAANREAAKAKPGKARAGTTKPKPKRAAGTY